MEVADPGRGSEAPAEAQPGLALPKRACRLSPRRRWVPCIPCHVFSVLFFVVVLVFLWLALRG